MDARVTFDQVNRFLAKCRQQLASGDSRFDLSGLEHVDSSVLAALLALQRERRCEFINPGANLRKLANLYGVDALLFK